MKIKKPYLVHVTWEDAAVGNSWTDAASIEPSKEFCETVGWLVYKSKKHLIVAVTATWKDKDFHSCNGEQQIPAGMVRKIRRIKG